MTAAGQPPPAPGAGPERPADRRGSAERRRGERRRQDIPVAVDRRSGVDRRQGERRRSINEYELSSDEQALANRIQRHREDHGGQFPTVRALLQIMRDLGYDKRR